MNHKKIFIISLIAFFLIEGAGIYIGSKGLSLGEKKVVKKYTKFSMQRINYSNRLLKNRIQEFAPASLYIVIDTGKNRLFFKRGETVLKEAIISCGSGNILKDPAGKKQWVFDTPKGTFTVKSKYTSPVWTKPDWAFIEEGEQIPRSIKERKEEGMMGDYSLGFGNGYFIHGTLYTRLLGRNVTHGCIRVGDSDLKAIYDLAEIGTKIFIF
jgi:lipoprotein-anchoring transpeptidase ErfK/SrfK